MARKYVGAAQTSKLVGAAQQQAQSGSDTFTDSMTGADALLAGAGVVPADSMAGADSLLASAAHPLADSMTGVDNLTLSGSGVETIADSMTGLDAQATTIYLLDHIKNGLATDIAHDLFFDGSHIHLANWYDGLRAYTFDGVTFTNVGHEPSAGGTAAAYGVWGNGSRIFLASRGDGLRAYTFDGANYVNVGFYPEGLAATYDVCGDGTYIYGAHYSRGLYAYSYDGVNFTRLDTIDDGGNAMAVWCYGGIIYLANKADGIRAYTFDGTTLVNVGHTNDGDGYNIWGDGQYLYACLGTDGFAVYTFDGANFTLLDLEPINCLGAWSDGEFIYVASMSQGLRVYEFDGATLTLIDTRDDGKVYYDVRGVGRTVFVANGEDCLRAYTFRIGLTAAAETPLADSMTGADALTQAAAEQLADSLIGADALTPDAADVPADSMTGAEALVADAQVPVADAMTGGDALVPGAGLSPADAATLSDEILASAADVLGDSMSGVDSLSGAVGPGILDPIGIKSSDSYRYGSKQPKQGRMTVDNHARPVTSITTSSSNTTFTNQGVVDASAWDLSDVEIGHVLVAEGDFFGRITEVGANAVTVESWFSRGRDLQRKAALIPTNGSKCTVYKVIEARQILIASLPGNNKPVYLGFSSDVEPGAGHPIANNPDQANGWVSIKAAKGAKLNLTDIWLVAGPDQTVEWQTETEEAFGKDTSTFPIQSLADVMSGQDSLEALAAAPVADSMTGAEELQADAAIVLSDSMTGVDSLGAATMDVSPTRLDFWYDLVNLNVTITNNGTGPLNWEINNIRGAGYLSFSATSGTIAAGGNTVVTVTADRACVSPAVVEGYRYWNSFNVDDTDGVLPTVPVETHVMKLYTPSAAWVAAMPETSVVVTSPVVNRNIAGEATWYASGEAPPYANKLGLFRQGRGPWEVSIVGIDTVWPSVTGPVVTTTVKAFALDNKEWVPFVSGTPTTLDEQADYNLVLNGVDEANFGRSDIQIFQFAYRSSVWEKCYDAAGPYTSVKTGARVQPVAVIQPSHTAAAYYHNVGSSSSALEMQTDPYQGPSTDAVEKGDMWIPSDDVTSQIAPPRTYEDLFHKPPLYLYNEPDPGDVPRHDDWLEAVASMTDEWWANIPGVTYTDGSITFAITGGPTYHYRGNRSEGSIVNWILAHAMKWNWLGGGYTLNMSGGDEDQVVDLYLSQDVGVKFLRVGLLQTYGALRPHGYFMYTYIGYTQNVWGIVPGADYHKNISYYGDPRFYWGSGITGPAGTSGFRPSGGANEIKICLKKTGGVWVVQYVNGAGVFLNVAKTGVVNIVY